MTFHDIRACLAAIREWASGDWKLDESPWLRHGQRYTLYGGTVELFCANMPKLSGIPIAVWMSRRLEVHLNNESAVMTSGGKTVFATGGRRICGQKKKKSGKKKKKAAGNSS